MYKSKSTTYEHKIQMVKLKYFRADLIATNNAWKMLETFRNARTRLRGSLPHT